MHIDEVNFPIVEAWSGELEQSAEVMSVRGSGLPVVSIGRPNWWPGEAILGQGWQSPAGGRRYGLARFSFSLKHPRPKNMKSADFNVRFVTTGSGENPVAYDLFPQAVTETRKDSIKLIVGPSLKFSEVEGSLGGVETTLDATNAVPVITAFGVGESAVNWNFQSQAAHPLIGSRIVYAIVEFPAAAGNVQVELYLRAEAQGRFSDLIGRTPREASERLTFVLGS